MSDISWNLDVMTAVLSILAIILVVKWINQNHKLPPGPWLFPVIGGLRLLAGNPVTVFKSLRQKYGDVFCFKVGSQLLVVLNGYDTIKEALVKRADDFSDRPDNFINTALVKRRGILGNSGKQWKDTRTFTISALREFDFGKRSLEIKIKEEVDVFVEQIQKEEDNPFDINDIVHVSVSNVICNIVFGKRFEYNNEDFKWLLSKLDIRRSSPTSVVTTFPALRFVPFDPFRVNKVLNDFKDIIEYFLAFIASHKETFDEHELRDLIDAFICEQRKNEKGNRILQDDNLSFVMLNLFAAGTETTSSTIRWAIIYLLRNQKVQHQMFNEIETVVGLSRTPSIADRPSMPYCDAVIAEVLRISNIVPLSVAHGAKKDIDFKGYRIPRGTIIIPNLGSILHDPELFACPERFNPDRFLDKDGNFDGAKNVKAFSLGRRVCLGEAVARMELFLFLTTLVQKFDLLPEDNNNLPSEEGIFGITYGPKPYKFRAIHRK